MVQTNLPGPTPSDLRTRGFGNRGGPLVSTGRATRPRQVVVIIIVNHVVFTTTLIGSIYQVQFLPLSSNKSNELF